MAVELGEHQIKARAEIKNGSIVKGGVGSGKTRVALAYWFITVCQGTLPINGRGTFGEMKTPTDLYVITTAKKRDNFDWFTEAAPFGISSDPATSVGPVRMIVDSWNNIAEYVDVKDAFFIFDEQRLVGAGTWTKAFIKIAKQNQWIMLSATPGDTWMDYIPVFVAHGFYKNRTEFIRTHVVYNTFRQFPQVDHYVETARLERYRQQIIVEMPYERHTTRHVQNVLVEYNTELFDLVAKKRWHIYEDRPIRDIQEFGSVMRKLVNSDASRLGEVMKLLESHPRLIIFYNFNYELELLRTLQHVLNIAVAEWNGHKHEEIPDTDEWIYLVQYTAGAEGWNCVTTDTMVFWSLNHSYKIWEQSKGRIDRLNTPFTDLWYYVFRSNSPVDNRIVKSLATKRDFNMVTFSKEMLGGIDPWKAFDDRQKEKEDAKLG